MDRSDNALGKPTSRQNQTFDAGATASTNVAAPLLIFCVAAQWWAVNDRTHVRHVTVAAGLPFAFGLALNQVLLLFVHRPRPYDVGLTHLIIPPSADLVLSLRSYHGCLCHRDRLRLASVALASRMFLSRRCSSLRRASTSARTTRRTCSEARSRACWRPSPCAFLIAKDRARTALSQAYCSKCKPMDFAQFFPPTLTALLASLVECIEALTVILAVCAVFGSARRTCWDKRGATCLTTGDDRFGPVLTLVPTTAIHLVFGFLLFAFGFRWLRKAVRRAAGVIPLRDEVVAYARHSNRLRGLSANAKPARPYRYGDRLSNYGHRRQ